LVSHCNVVRPLWRRARRRPQAAAIVGPEGEASYAALVARASAVAEALLTADVRPDTPVAIVLGRGVDAAAAFFGVMAVGGIAVLIDDAQRPRQIEHMLRHSGARDIVTAGSVLGNQPRPIRASGRLVDMEKLGAAPSADIVPVSRHPNDVAQIVYTSGSAGLPKGVTVTHGNLWASTRAVVAYLGITSSDRIASLLPFSFVYGLSQVLCAVRAGATLVVERSPLPQEIAATLRRCGVTVLPAVPPLWLRLLQAPEFRDAPLPALRVMTNAGGRLPVDAVQGLRRTQPRAKLFLMYGLTEALRCTYLPPEEVDRRPASIGRPLPGAEVYVVREDGAVADPGEVGELVYRGPTVTLGYWNDPLQTARVFRPNPFRPMGCPDDERVVFTGDLVRRDTEGFLYFVGRTDRIIKAMGYRVGPDEVIDVLHSSGEVSQAEVVGEPGEPWGARIVAYVALAPGGSVERLKAYCDREMPRHMRPARIEVRGALPLLANGKHDIESLRATAAAGG